jgi:hypothetical protein
MNPLSPQSPLGGYFFSNPILQWGIIDAEVQIIGQNIVRRRAWSRS